jgi:hypothetical protein
MPSERYEVAFICRRMEQRMTTILDELLPALS